MVNTFLNFNYHRLNVSDNCIIYDTTEKKLAEEEEERLIREEEERLQAIEDAKTDPKELKASAKAKLIAGEALTEEEANTIVI